jgi:hypothetical protein
LFGLARASDSETPYNALPFQWLSLVLVTGIAAGISWTPWLGDFIYQSWSETDNEISFSSSPRRLDGLLYWAHRKKLRRLTLFVALVQSRLNDTAAESYWVALNQTRPGSWLELFLAEQVYRQLHVQRSTFAAGILRRHGRSPHRRIRNEMIPLMARASILSGLKPATAPLELEEAPPPSKLERNRSIALPQFKNSAPKENLQPVRQKRVCPRTIGLQNKRIGPNLFRR